MGRSKSTPVRFNNLTNSIHHANKHLKKYKKGERGNILRYRQQTIIPPDESNIQYYLGDVSFGRSSNVIPESWTKCKFQIDSKEDSILQLEFDSTTTVIVNITNDPIFIKGLLTSKVFAIKFVNEEDNFVAQLFIRKLPLPVFNKTIGATLKTAVATIFDIEIELETDISSNEKTQALEELYKKIKTSQCKNDSFPKISIHHPLLKPTLRPYQEDAVRWMVRRETPPENAEMLHPLYQPLLLKSELTVYFDKHTGYIDINKPLVSSLRTGGILADEMGLGKTVEVLACILSNPKPKEDCLEHENVSISNIDTTDENTEGNATPTVSTQPKKHKRKLSIASDKEEEYSDKPKKTKVPNDWVKSSSKKSETRIALEMWYHNMLQDVSIAKSSKASLNTMQCICGDTDMKGAVRCNDCFKYQHATCLGYKKAPNAYRCPKCWMEQPYLDSKATLIVCPSTLLSQWSEEICKHVTADFKILIYEGSKAAPIYPTDIKEYDLVLTTYNVLQAELRLTETGEVTLRRESRYSTPGSPLARINWWRLCLDEAQAVEVTSCMVSAMAKKIQAYHRWAVTGTPITRDISDLFGLLDYLQLSPYNEFETWQYLLYLPYALGNVNPMLQFLSQVMWRSSKNDVIDQINIPEQTVNEYMLEFSAVEKYYYKREHELCTYDFLKKLKSYADCSIPLTSIDKSSFKQLMAPLRTIRNACSYPSATRGRYLATRKPVSSMEDLLDALIERNKTDSEDNLRVVVSALNGLAGIYLLMHNSVEAVNMYREVMQLAARFDSEDSKAGVCIDKLQLIHTFSNLAEVLETLPSVAPTLRDATLREDCIVLQEKYMEKYLTQNLVAYQESLTATNLVSQLQEKSTLAPGEWYSSLINWVLLNDLGNDLFGRINALLTNANNQNLNFSNERKLLYFVATWDEDVISLRSKTISMLNKMFTYTEESPKVIVHESLVEAAVDCHLRPEQKLKKKKNCLVCTVSVQMRQYEAKLFDMKKTKSTEEEDISNQGSWKPTSEELVLKALTALGKAKNADEELVSDGELYLSVLDAMKKEFKQLRKFWTYLDQQVCAHDEINMCKIRLSLKNPNDEPKKRQSDTDRILKQLSTVLENKLQFINFMEAHELDYQVSVLKSEEKQNMAALERNLGTHSYLETLRSQQYAGHNPDPCPICKNPLQKQWNILPCGHCYCLDCIQILIEKTNVTGITCCMCRQIHKIVDISFIHTDEVSEQSTVGNSSSKIEAVIKLIMKLKKESNGVKVLVFSIWPGILDILKSALKNNNITAEHVNVVSKLSRCLSNFKNEDQNITALLLPIKLGSKGLNLIEATHVILLEPLLDPGDELQAIGRVHRIGQTKPTTVHKFIVKNTIEESIYHATSSNADIWNKNKVTLQQLRNLFEESVEDD